MLKIHLDLTFVAPLNFIHFFLFLEKTGEFFVLFDGQKLADPEKRDYAQVVDHFLRDFSEKRGEENGYEDHAERVDEMGGEEDHFAAEDYLELGAEFVGEDSAGDVYDGYEGCFELPL